MVGFDPSRAAEDLAQYATDLEQKARRYGELQGRMAAVSASASSAGGRVASGGAATPYVAPKVMTDVAQASATLTKALSNMKAAFKDVNTYLEPVVKGFATASDDKN